MKLLLVEAGPKILPVLPDHLIERATTSLEARGVTFLTGLPVTNVAGNEIDLKDGQKLVANTFVWTGGVQGNPLIGESGLEVNRGRATVDAYLLLLTKTYSLLETALLSSLQTDVHTHQLHKSLGKWVS